MADYLNYDTEQHRVDYLTALELAMGEPIYPGNELRIFVEALVAINSQAAAAVDDAIKQSRLRYARGEKLDDIGDDRGVIRSQASSARAVFRFSIEEPARTNIIIPQGLRITGLDCTTFFAVPSNRVLEAGKTSIDIECIATVPGEQANYIPAGAFNAIVDVSMLPEYRLFKVENIEQSHGGEDIEDDEVYRQRIRQFPNQLSTAGPAKAYKYWAMTADETITDVLVQEGEETVTRKASVYDKHAFFNGRLLSKISFDKEGSYEVLEDDLIDFTCTGEEEEVTATITRGLDGVVKLIPICKGGTIPSEEILQKVYDAVTQPDIKPLTDYVVVEAPEPVSYDIEFKYYCFASDEGAVVKNVEGENGAIQRYVAWQDEALNRGLNPDMLERLVLGAEFDENRQGAYRVDIVKPVFDSLEKNQVPKFSGNLKVSHEVIYDV